MARTRIIGNFPFRVVHETIGDPAFSLETVRKWYWRVSRWTVTITLSGTLSGNSTARGDAVSLILSEATQTTRFGRLGLADGTGLSDETALIAGPPMSAAFYYDALSTFPGGGAEATGIDSAGGTPIYGDVSRPPAIPEDTSLYVPGGLSLFSAVEVIPATDTTSTAYVPQAPLRFDPASGLYRPSLNLNAASSALAIPFAGYNPSLKLAVGTVDAIRGTINADNPVTNYPITLVDIPVTLDGQYYGTVAGLFQLGDVGAILPGYDVSGLAYHIDISPAAYWAYAGNDGVAVYDALTGEFATKPGTTRPFTLDEVVALPVP